MVPLIKLPLQLWATSRKFPLPIASNTNRHIFCDWFVWMSKLDSKTSVTLICSSSTTSVNRLSVCPFFSRVKEQFPGTEVDMFAHFIGESLKRTKVRDYVPSQEEIVALLTRQEMTTTVYCHGGGSCKISINSHTTAGEVSVMFPSKKTRSRSLRQKRELKNLFFNWPTTKRKQVGF